MQFGRYLRCVYSNKSLTQGQSREFILRFILFVLWGDFSLKHKRNYVVKLVISIWSTVEQIISCITVVVSCPWIRCVLLCSSSSSIMRLCPQRNAVISCAWTCLYVPHHWQKKGLFRRAAPWCFNTPPPRRHHSGIFPLCWESITHEKSVCLLLIRGKPELHSVTPFSSESGTDTQTLCTAHELTLLWVLQLHHPLKGLMSWLKY